MKNNFLLEFFTFLIFLNLHFVSGQDSSLINLPLMTWYEIPNSKMESVKPNPLPPNQSGFEAVMTAWSGGAYDTKRDRLIVWGGGHSDYSGNEIYVFDMNTLKWSRLTEPSTDVGGNESSGEYPDGNPRSRHTYNYIQYVPSIDRFCTFGGHGLYPSGQIGTDKTHAFDFESLTWSRLANTTSFGIGAFSAVDASTGHVWVQGTESQYTFSEYNPDTDTWIKRTGLNEVFRYNYYFTAAIDPNKKKCVVIGNGEAYVFDISNTSNVQLQKLNTTGNKAPQNADSPGFDYDPVSQKFVAWNSGSSLYFLDIDTGVWEEVEMGGDNPGSPASRGTFGRFRYVPSLNGVVVVNSVGKNVFFGKIGTITKRPVTPLNIKITN